MIISPESLLHRYSAIGLGCKTLYEFKSFHVNTRKIFSSVYMRAYMRVCAYTHVQTYTSKHKQQLETLYSHTYVHILLCTYILWQTARTELSEVMLDGTSAHSSFWGFCTCIILDNWIWPAVLISLFFWKVLNVRFILLLFAADQCICIALCM